MKAKLDGIYSPDLPSGKGAMPADPTDCWIIIHADIGIDGGEGMDCFTVYVTTPKFLTRAIPADGYQLGRGLLVLSKFDWDVVESAIEAICANAHAESWGEIASFLSRNFHYEYESPAHREPG